MSTHDSYADEDIARILTAVRTVAVIGASDNPARPSYGAVADLAAKGYIVFPVNPALAGQEILGHEVYGSLAEVPAPVHMVDIFRNSAAALEVTREAIALKDALGIRVIWMQLGVRNDEAAQEAEAAGLEVVMNRCPKIEHRRLTALMAQGRSGR